MNTGKPTLLNRARNWFTRERWYDLVTLAVCIFLAVAVNWVAYQAVSSDQAMLNILSLDEGVYVDFLSWAFYTPLANLDVIELAVLHEPFGYGSIFWYVYGLIGAIPHFFGGFTAEIITYRVVSAAWLGVAMWLLYKIVRLVRQDIWPARLAALSLLVLPGFYFYYKAFSAEFMHVAFLLATIYLFLLYLQTNQTRWCYWAALWFGLTVGIKPSVGVILPVLGLVWLWQVRKQPRWVAVKLFIISGIVAGLGFFIANPYVLLLRRAGANLYLSAVKQNLESNATNHGGSIEGLGFSSWLHTILVPTFLPYWFLVQLGIALGWIIYKQRSEWKYLWVITGSSILYLGYIMWSVKKLWAWYLFPGVALLVVLPWLVNYSLLGLKKTWQRCAILGLLLIILFSVNFSGIQSRYQAFRTLETSESFQIKQQAKAQFDAWLPTQSYANTTVLKSPYLYVDLSQFPDKQLAPANIWGNLTASYLTTYQPGLLLIEKDYGFTADDSVVGSWSSFPDIQTERVFFANLTGSGVEVDGVRYHYSQVFETDNFKVYARTE